MEPRKCYSRTDKIFDNLRRLNTEMPQNDTTSAFTKTDAQRPTEHQSAILGGCKWYDELGNEITVPPEVLPGNLTVLQPFPVQRDSVLNEETIAETNVEINMINWNSWRMEQENDVVANIDEPAVVAHPVVNLILDQHESSVRPNNHTNSAATSNHPPILITSDINIETAKIIELRQNENISEDHTSQEKITAIHSPPSVTLDSHQSESSDEEMETRKRKSLAAKEDWTDFKNKKLRQEGKTYRGWSRPRDGVAQRGTERQERKMGPPCNSKVCLKSKVRHCNAISEEDRFELFGKFWSSMNWDQRKIYIASLVKKSGVARSTKVPGELSRRTGSYNYTVKKLNGQVVTVCKKLFLSTFGLKEWTVLNWASKFDSGIHPSQEVKNEARREIRKQDPKNKSKIAKQILVDFLDSLPKLPSHYCRRSTMKMYVEPIYGDSMTAIFKEYQNICLQKSSKPVSRYTFDHTIKEKNISFQQPKKDKCDTCCEFETKNIEEDIYQMHIQRKQLAREEKTKDKLLGQQSEAIVLTQDVQAVKVCPFLNASALYYKTKLLCHNFTVFNINSHHCCTYWFNETDADLTANTFASCIVDYILALGAISKPVVIWSDGCGYQNKNSILSNALLSLSVNRNITIFQKFLERGHTQMEVDSVHALIERNLKTKSIYLPSDYCRITREARKKEPYEVKSISYNFVKDYSFKPKFDSIRPGRRVNEPTVNNIKVIKYSPDGNIQVKLNFSENFRDLPGRNKDKPVTDLLSFPQLRNGPIKKKKNGITFSN